MLRPTLTLLAALVALAACLVTGTGPVVTTAAAGPAAPGEPPLALLGDGTSVRPLKDAALVEMTPQGWRYVAGQQDSHLTVSVVEGRVRFEDTGTRVLRRLPKQCTELEVPVGVAAECRVPARFADGMYLQVWPRLGDDVVDGSTLPAQLRLWVLADAGDDTMYGGAGDDFLNGAQGHDIGHGGGGDDWLRTGKGNDRLWGGDGDDRLVGVGGRDRLHGEAGTDRVEGGPGADVLSGGEGRDVVSCAGGRDRATVDADDRVRHCEQVTQQTAPEPGPPVTGTRNR
ncbi:calcium-binding protein [Nocardioides sp. TF02-7]|uniref:calcium-binding protein n=1 Tax=Nocardioides sp. TF02-7 TaxID=2917724 RepID=UPI001F050F25|nr:calcium-binding protein [Nocardioides sp. TF02-7]UMG94249.1 hypothetical protein MF408_09650 [Nocardioides sp. TF02-7]